MDLDQVAYISESPVHRGLDSFIGGLFSLIEDGKSLSVCSRAGEMVAYPSFMHISRRSATYFDNDVSAKYVPSYSRMRCVIRRYSKANGLFAFVTLTADTRAGEVSDYKMRRFFERLKYNAFKNHRMPYVWTLGRSLDGRTHAHALLPKVDISLLKRAWGHGMCHLEVVQNTHEDFDRISNYMVKNSLEVERKEHSHKYFAAKSYHPPKIRVDGMMLKSPQELYVALRSAGLNILGEVYSNVSDGPFGLATFHWLPRTLAEGEG